MSKAIYLVIFITTGFFTFCTNNESEKTVKTLSFSAAEIIPVPEPSGLAMTLDETGFWVVSDKNSKVYLINSRGSVVKSFKVKGESLEGITVIDRKTIGVVLERTREVVIIDTSGKEINRAALNLKGELNSGLEGITYDPVRKIFYVLNEKKPRLLITLDEELNELSRDTLNFSKDVSGIFYDNIDSTLWILSDESQRIFKTDLTGNPIKEYKINVTQPEGITLNEARTKLFIVSDKTENLYVFNLN
jgi:uncharacterized protein YjiK